MGATCAMAASIDALAAWHAERPLAHRAGRGRHLSRFRLPIVLCQRN